MNDWAYIFLISMLPWIELRGGIPYGILKAGFDPLLVAVIAILANAAIIYPAFVFLDWFFDMMKTIPLMSNMIRKTQDKAKPYVDRYGLVGLGAFVAVPLPGTGAYAGALAAHILGMKNKKALVSIAAGVATAGVVVTVITVFFRESLDFFIKII
ncbi:MAG: small multi-drug export protein [Candidatus Altiarchaeota archaeon]